MMIHPVCEHQLEDIS
jgi:hypothetical protein